ncbi:MAG: hypothetical protein AAGE05_13560 [Pseudomonadota bacterium]
MAQSENTENETAALNNIGALASELKDLDMKDDFETVEKRLEDLRELALRTEFSDPRKHEMARVIYYECAGSHWSLRATQAYTKDVDPTESARCSIRAIENHRKALEHIQNIDLGDTEEINVQEQNAIAFHQAQLDDARGILALNEGEVQLRKGQFERAKETLSEAVENLRKAEAAFTADSERNEERPVPGFSDPARALLEEANSEIALIRGALDEAANAENRRAAALEAGHERHSLSDLPSSKYFTRRMKHDAEFAHARSELFRNASALQDKRPWFATYLFFVMAIGSAVALVYVLGSLEMIANPFVIGLVFVFVFVVAGVATRLGKWSEGAELLSSIAKSSGSGGSGD